MEKTRAKKAAKEEEAKTMTLDEWKAEQAGANAGPKFNLRKAGKGSDLAPQAKKATEEVEAKTMTLDEWKAQQAGENAGPKFNLWKPCEGSDLDPKN